MADLDIPGFSFSEEEIAKIKASVGAIDVDPSIVPIEGDAPLPKRRGRPPGSKNKSSYETAPVSGKLTVELPAAPLTKREEREVATRLANILSGATGMTAVVKPYLPMTDEEAKAIAEPLASYLVRNEPTSGIAREILENYDLLAMAMGVGAYTVRVYSDRRAEVAERKPDNTTAIQRISEVQASDNGRGPDEGRGPLVSIPNASRSGTSPFDI